jgi:hypothetical protein
VAGVTVLLMRNVAERLDTRLRAASAWQAARRLQLITTHLRRLTGKSWITAASDEDKELGAALVSLSV